jgi:hypothetical protein
MNKEEIVGLRSADGDVARVLLSNRAAAGHEQRWIEIHKPAPDWGQDWKLVAAIPESEAELVAEGLSAYESTKSTDSIDPAD